MSLKIFKLLKIMQNYTIEKGVSSYLYYI